MRTKRGSAKTSTPARGCQLGLVCRLRVERSPMSPLAERGLLRDLLAQARGRVFVWWSGDDHRHRDLTQNDRRPSPAPFAPEPHSFAQTVFQMREPRGDGSQPMTAGALSWRFVSMMTILRSLESNPVMQRPLTRSRRPLVRRRRAIRILSLASCRGSLLA
jgi:hypothetical protein